MLSRHKAACILAMREDTPDRLGTYEAAGRAVTGPDTAYQSWQTTTRITEQLADSART